MSFLFSNKICYWFEKFFLKKNFLRFFSQIQNFSPYDFFVAMQIILV